MGYSSRELGREKARRLDTEQIRDFAHVRFNALNGDISPTIRVGFQRLSTEDDRPAFTLMVKAGLVLCRHLLTLLEECQQVGVNCVGLSRGHAVRKALVGFQCAILQQLCRQRC